MNHLGYFVQTESVELLEKLERLDRLHHTVELAVVLEQFLQLPKSNIGASTR